MMRCAANVARKRDIGCQNWLQIYVGDTCVFRRLKCNSTQISTLTDKVSVSFIVGSLQVTEHRYTRSPCCFPEKVGAN
jgi:hypothetical protein